MTRRSKRPRRKKYSVDEVLIVPGEVPRPVERPAPRRLWLAPTRALVTALPMHEETRKGREFSVFVRLLLGVAAVMMVTKGRREWVWGALGVLTALSSLILPLSETRRRRWLRKLDALKEPTIHLEARPARLEFDGRKASIRVDERVWRSLRPYDPPGSTRLVRVGQQLWLGLIPPEGRKRDELWFSASVDSLPEEISASETLEEDPDIAMHLSPDDFCSLYEAFIHRLKHRP